MTTVLLIGGGGREHALADSIDRSPLLTKLYAAPGNPGIARLAECVALNPGDHDAVVGFARSHDVDLVVVGPEAPLVDGLADSLMAAGIACFGPSAKAAMLEAAKEFARDFCARHHIPQPGYAPFDDIAEAKAYVRGRFNGGACVIKADGLAAGKGVVVAEDEAEAFAAIEMILGDANFGGASLVVEDRIHGTEASLFAVVDGPDAVMIGSAQDHKRAYDGDKGPNTGGMGAVSPAPALTDDALATAWRDVVEKTAKGMAAEGMPYRGFLYAGLMLTDSGPQVIEFNCRFGDPEAEVVLPRLKSDLLSAMLTATSGGLGHVDFRFDPQVAVTVVMANGGYPGAYETGGVITGLEDDQPGTMVFHAGTTAKDAAITATGGRVLAVTALGDDQAEARAKAYARVKTITWPGAFHRSDIAAG
ncbi:MAG: phosphoribosylamine--glycine ligase [Alphaproteobacteria bacterium]|nr:phosphoribosylamine--glycine ligase [Alphaproteobacteria bacterium]